MTRGSRSISVTLGLVGALFIGSAGCGGGDDEATTGGASVAHEFEPFPADVPFVESEWTTSTDFPLLGDPRAKRDSDRPFQKAFISFPPTLRTDGPNSNGEVNSTIEGLQFETLLGLHPETEEYHPMLASHWRIERDEEAGTQTFWFRINEKARFADGEPVTARDVYYTWWHRTQEDRKEPSSVMTFREGYEEPVIVDRQTIKITTKDLNWRSFLYFSAGMAIFQAEDVYMPGEEYLKKYNWGYQTGTGPYVLKPEGIKKGESITLNRRDDWWAENERWALHTYNFKKVKILTVRDQELQYEMFKKGELDWYLVGRAQRWVEEIPTENIVTKGWVQRRKIYNQAPRGYSGIAFNMRKPPFNDKRVRLAFAHLFNRETLMEKLFYNEYEYLNSMFPGRDWGAGDELPILEYNPDRAAELFAEAGWSERNDEGWLVDKDGKPFEVTMTYGWPTWERIWLVIQESYQDAGVKFNLELIDAATLTKKISDRQFTIHYQPWGALLFPNPETTLRSDLADKKANNNITGFKNARVDELCEKYNTVFERAEQKKITREIDRIFFDEVPYAYGWYAAYRRIMYWDRFGHPDSYFTRINQYPRDSMLIGWWHDTEKENALQAAMKSDGTLPQGEMIVKPWAKKK